MGRTDTPRGTAGRTGRIDGPQNTEEHDESPLVATTLHGARRVATSRNDAPRGTAGRTGRIDGPQNTEEHDESQQVASTLHGARRVAISRNDALRDTAGRNNVFLRHSILLRISVLLRGTEDCKGFRRTSSDRGDTAQRKKSRKNCHLAGFASKNPGHRDSAERTRFELVVRVTPYVGLANRWFQPLTHLSGSNGEFPIAGQK